ncbi:MAG TPA: DUF4097 family beta strand repeat-containing protein [Bacteroidota bacterium]
MKHNNLIVAALLATVLIGSSLSAQDSREINKTVALKADGELSIDTFKGSITVTTWDKPQVDIHATITADDEFGSRYSADKVRDTEIRVDVTDGRVRIKTDYDNVRDRHDGFWSWFGGNSGSLPLVDYKITMPRTAALKIKDYKSRSTVADLSGSIDLNTYKGDVDIAGVDGSVRLETYKGEARISFVKLAAKSQFQTYKGDIRVVLPKAAGFDLDADLGYRTDFVSDFEVDIPTSGRHHHDKEFRGAVNGGGPELVLKCSKGNIQLRQH